MKKSIKKALSLVLAVSAVTGLMSGCSTESKTPEFSLKLDYEGKKYTLEYTLHRSIAPTTVAHFINLVENNYYDGLCFHDYKTGDKMYTGGYKYEDEELAYQSYYDIVKSYKNFKQSVWKDKEQTQGLYTLRGEFSQNGFKVGDENNSGALKESFGAISMYYTEKNCEDQVYIYNGASKEVQREEYEYDSATSLFSIALKDFGSVNSSYCTFAVLKEDSKSVLEELVEEIEKDEDFAREETVKIDLDDIFVRDQQNEAQYQVLYSALTVVDVKITKY